MTPAKHRFSRIWAAITTLFVSLVLLVLVLTFAWRPIEQQLAQASHTVLQQAGMEWADVTTHNRGRDVLVLGAAPNQLAVEQALAMVRNVEGVRLAQFAGTTSSVADTSNAVNLDDPLAPNPVTAIAQESLTASLSSDILTLTGKLSDADAVRALVSAAQQTFGEDKVLNQILVKSATSADDPSQAQPSTPLALTDLSEILVVLKSTPFIHAEFAQEPSGFILDEQSLTLTGILAKHADRHDYWQSVVAITDQQVRNRTAVLDPSGRPPLENIVLVEPEICAQEIKDELESATINFEVEEAVIKPDSYPLLDTLENALNSCPDAYFEIVGHADDSGNDAFNNKLSADRASAVKDFLVELGVNPSNLTSSGKGSSEPLVPDSSPQARAKNRRVEFVLIDETVTDQDKLNSDETSEPASDEPAPNNVAEPDLE